jgi:hypothetical protein
VQVSPVDPRDITSEEGTTTYRVHFWRPLGAAGVFQSSEFEVTEADAEEALDYARTTVGSDQSYTVYAVVERPNGRCLLRLAGKDPTAT